VEPEYGKAGLAMMWLLVLAAAIGVFLVTGSPLLAALLPYLSAARASLRSAIWLRSADPWTARGKTCFWFYLATAAWRAAVAAFVSVLLFFVTEAVTGVGPDIDVFARTMIVIAVGAGWAAILGLVGMAAAVARGVRVFVIPNIARLAGGEFDAIGAVASARPRFNHAIFVLAMAMFLPVSVAGTIIAAIGGARDPNRVDNPLTWIGLGLLMLGPLAAVPLYVWLSNRVVALAPEDCWGDFDFPVESDELETPDPEL
jgi:hypothetical protein